MKNIKRISRYINLALSILILFVSCSKYDTISSDNQLNTNSLSTLHNSIKEKINHSQLSAKSSVNYTQILKEKINSEIKHINIIGINKYLIEKGYSEKSYTALSKIYTKNQAQDIYELIINKKLISNYKDASLVFYAYEFSSLIENHKKDKNSIISEFINQ